MLLRFFLWLALCGFSVEEITFSWAKYKIVKYNDHVSLFVFFLFLGADGIQFNRVKALVI